MMLFQAAGVPTEFKQFNGTSHGFLHFSLPQTVEAMKMSATALRAAFGLAKSGWHWHTVFGWAGHCWPACLR